MIHTAVHFWVCCVLFCSILWFLGSELSVFLPGEGKAMLLFLGGGGALLGWRFCHRKREERKDRNELRVILLQGKKRIPVRAIVDSGNSLIEPISGKPVCVLDPRVARLFWGPEEPFRAVPYHSIGTEQGILRAYLLKELHIETEGPRLVRKNVYVAVSQEPVAKEGRAGFIIHPDVLENHKRGKEKVK